MNKDVLFTIYGIIHRDLTKQLIAEYHKRLERCHINIFCDNVCKCGVAIKYDHELNSKSYNYRLFHNGLIRIYTKYVKVRCYISYR